MDTTWTRRDFLSATALAAGASAGSAAVASAAQSSPAGKPKKIVGICCSPRKGKTTAAALRTCLEAVRAELPGAETELIELAGMKIPGGPAAGVPLEAGEKDDFPALIPRLADPKVAGIVIATPVYFGNMSYLCKAFLDRCMVFFKDRSLANKVAGVIAVGGARNGGQELTVRSVQVALMSQQMIVVGDAPPSGHWGGTVWSGIEGGVEKDDFGLATARNLGRRVAGVAKLLYAD
ncbi:MAG: flavodoxin family protein [Pirellulales bacterium]|nr:flavodoxin family protein [Pirellulales bacterium]